MLGADADVEAIDAQPLLVSIAIAAAALAIAAGWRERRRARRTDPDAVGAVDWLSVQMAALVVLAITGLIALHG